MMGRFLVYLTRIVPALSVIGLAFLLFVALVVDPIGKTEQRIYHGDSTYAQLILSVYTILLNISSFVFPARLCWSIGHVTKKMKETAAVLDNPKRRKTPMIKHGQTAIAYPTPLFVIIVPAYQESVGTLEETFRVLASHSQARFAYHVRLDTSARLNGYEFSCNTFFKPNAPSIANKRRFTLQWKPRRQAPISKPLNLFDRLTILFTG